MARKNKKKNAWIPQLIILSALLLVAAYSIRYQYIKRTYTEVAGELYVNDEPLDMRDKELSPEEYDKLCAEYPEREILWLVPVCGERLAPETESYCVPAGADYKAFTAILPRLAQLKSVDLSEADWTAAQLADFMANYPGITVSGYRVPLGGVRYDPAVTELTLRATNELLDELTTVLHLFQNLEVIDFGNDVLSTEDAAALRAQSGAEVHCRFSFCGTETNWDATLLNLQNKEIEDLSEVEDAIRAMPKLERVEMDGCNVPDEALDALNLKYPDVEVVWTIYVHGAVATHSLRTDADNFCLSRYNATSYPGFDNAGLYALRYCHNMVTLDLGHTEIEDLSMCEQMPHLRFLILGDTFVTDFSPLENCNEIYYIEAFLLKLGDVPEPDISALIGKESLKHLNLCYAPFTSVEALGQLTQLERLWLKGSKLSTAQIEQLRAMLPDTEICTNNGDESSVDYFWRHNDAYFEMRDSLNMPYAIAK